MSRPAVTPREAAADWLERREQGPLSPHDEARLSAWLSADARHAAAYEEMSRVYNEGGRSYISVRVVESTIKGAA